MRLDSASIAADLQLPAELAAAIEVARGYVEGEMKGSVTVTISWQSFTTWWATRHTGRATTDIDFTPIIRMDAGENAICNALVVRGLEDGARWMHPDAIKRMVRWLVEPAIQDEFNEAHSSFSDEETARRRAEWEREQAEWARQRRQESSARSET